MRYYLLIFNLVYFLMPTSTACAPQDMWINVFVHGTIGLRSHMNFSTFIHLMKDDIEETHYKKAVDQLRNDPFFFKIQPIQDLGLQPIQIPCKKNCSAASLFAKAFEKNMTPNPQIKNLYYTFGWSGLLSITERIKASKILYTALEKEVQKLTRFYPKRNIHIRLVCYSHGGSVALHLAEIPHKNLVIDELLLFGTPIQKETDYLIHDALFKKVYNFYSRKDLIQKMDCFSFKRFFSQRRFKKECLCEKLVQVELKVMTNKYPGSSRYHINRSPSHTELWFFGWTLHSYRKNFITYPLPLGTFLPNFIDLLATCAPDKQHVTITLYPDGTARIKERNKSWTCPTRWIELEKLHELQEEILTYAPPPFTDQEQAAHVNCSHKTTPEGLKKLEAKHAKKYKKSKKCHCCLCGSGMYDIP